MVSAGERRAAADVLASAKAKTARVRLVLDGDLLDRQLQLNEQLAAAEDDSDAALAVAREIVELEAEIDEAGVEFVFRGMGRGRWRKLLAEHPPTDEQKTLGAEFDVDTFPFHAMAACLVEPALTVDDLQALEEDALDEVSFGQLWAACLKACLGSGANHPSSAAARRLLASVPPNSEQPSS